MKTNFTLGLLLFACVNAFAFNFDANVPTNIQKQIKQDLQFISSIQGSNQSDLHKEIFGEVSGNAYEHFFNSRVTDIGMNSCGSPNAVACVIPYYGSSKMWLSKNYIKFSHPQIARLMIVFHESRHTEDQNDNWPHANCPSPFLDSSGKPINSIWTGAELAGEAACDETPYGSYGSSLILLKNISKYCTNCTEKVKMDSQIYGDDQFKRIIDEKAKKQIQTDLYQAT
jgi:hypothetical protein